MSSGSKKQTVGYWYKYLHHFGLCDGADALLEMRVGDRTAWRGLATTNQRLSVNKPKLFGGEESEGGLVGEFDLRMGGADQTANDYLIAQLGEDQPTHRGKLCVVWRGGRWSAMNPYPKPAAFKVRRILAGWENDTPWYPEKAAIPMIPPEPLAMYFAIDLSGSMDELTPNGQTRLTNMKTSIIGALNAVGGVLLPLGVRLDVMIVGWGGGEGNVLARESILRRDITSTTLTELVSWVSSRVTDYWTHFPAAVADAATFFGDSPATSVRMSFFITDGQPGNFAGLDPIAEATAAGQTLLAIAGLRAYGFNIDLEDTEQTAKLDNSDAGVSVVKGGEPDALTNAILEAIGGLTAMNPVHILYDSLTHSTMQGEPVGLINDAAWRAAADKCYSEGFGLCTEYAGGPIREFQRRILDVIAGGMSQSRVDGLYYVDLIRGDYDLESLPIIGPDDIVELVQEPSVVTEQVNSIAVEWFDPQTKQTRTTSPVQALGAIQAAGRPISETREYPEIPEQGLALRVAGRDCRAASSPKSRFELTLNTRAFDLRLGRQFRLQSPADGIADMVCVVMTQDNGTLLDGRCRFSAIQDVFGMPVTVYAAPEPGLAVPGENRPVAAAYQRLIEAPYVELVTSLSRADLDYLPDDAGYVLTMAARPSIGQHYTVATAGVGESYQTYGTAEWCPSALVVAAAERNATSFTLSGGTDLDDVEVGTWALWDDEIVRVDAIDSEALTLTLGRGCADTVPHAHAAGSRIWFCGDWTGTDGREYPGAETVRAKLLTRTTTGELTLSSAAELSVLTDSRALRPYPPGSVKVNDVAYPETIGEDDGIDLTWAHRDRLLQDDQLIDTTVGSIGPEAGTTYNLRFFHGVTNDLLREETGLTGTGYNYTTTDEIEDGGGSVTEDPHWASVKLLLNGNGTDGSTAIADASSFSTSVSRFGNTQIDTDYSLFGGGSILFDGSGDYLQTAQLLASNQAFTIDAGIRVASLSKTMCLFSQKTDGVVDGRFIVNLSTSGQINLFIGHSSGGINTYSASGLITAGTFHRLRVVRVAGGGFHVFVDGALAFSTATFTHALEATNFRVGRDVGNTSRDFVGWMDDIRVTPGVARSTAAYTPLDQELGQYIITGGLSPSVRVELESVRAGMTSRQRHDFLVARAA